VTYYQNYHHRGSSTYKSALHLSFSNDHCKFSWVPTVSEEAYEDCWSEIFTVPDAQLSLRQSDKQTRLGD